MLESILIKFSKKRGMHQTIRTATVTPAFTGRNRPMADERFAAPRRL